MAFDYPFEFAIREGEHWLADVEGIATIGSDHGDWYIEGIQIFGVKTVGKWDLVPVSQGSFLYQPIMLQLLGRERDDIEEAWRNQRAEYRGPMKEMAL